MEMSGQHHAPVTLSLRKYPGTHAAGKWVNPRTSLDALKEGNNVLSPPGFESPTVQSIA
jgi:hypothetical protein